MNPAARPVELSPPEERPHELPGGAAELSVSMAVVVVGPDDRGTDVRRALHQAMVGTKRGPLARWPRISRL